MATKKEAFYSKPNDLNERIDRLKTLKNSIKNNKERLLEALLKDMKRPEMEVYSSEIYNTIQEIDHTLKHIKSWTKPKKVKSHVAQKPADCYLSPEPLGKVLIIGPWNYPFHLVMIPLIGAVAAGNTAVIKPSEFSPYTSDVIEKIVKESFPKDYVSVKQGGVNETTALLSQRFDHIFFTGSTAVGKIVYEAAAKNMATVTLELGGKSPTIVDEDVDIELTAKRIAWGKYLNAGQNCISPDYILVHESREKELIQHIKRFIQEFYSEDPKQSTSYGRIVNKRHFDRLSKILKGCDVIHGGETDQSELYIEPTIVDGKKEISEEIFGPILPITTYADLDEAIAYVNARPKPLALYFFSKDKRKLERIVNETSSGGLCLNDTIIQVTSHDLPFGGVGHSGIGSYHGKFTFDTFTHYKPVVKKGFSLDLGWRYPPYDKVYKWLRKFK